MGALLFFVHQREQKKIITSLVSVCFTGCSLFGAFLLASVIIELPNFDVHPSQTYFLIVDIFFSFLDGLALFFSFKFSTDISSGLLTVCIILSVSQLYGSRISHIPLYMCSQLLKRVYCQTQGVERFQNKEYEVKGTWRSAVTDFLLYRWVHWDLVDEAVFSKITRYLSDVSKSTFPIIAYVYAKLPFLCCQ